MPKRWYFAKRGGLLVVTVLFALSAHALQASALPQPQGFVEVARHEVLIMRAATVEGVPAIMVAAGIMNQGNALTRPFGTDLFERAQVAAPFESPFTGANASVDIAQLTPEEMRAYIPGCSDACLFEPAMAVLGMAAKLRAADDLLPTGLDPTDRLMVLALAQNDGPGAAEAYLAAGGRWSTLYAERQGMVNNDQLRKILANTHFLLNQGFRLPPGVDLERWARIVQTQGASEEPRWPEGLAMDAGRSCTLCPRLD